MKKKATKTITSEGLATFEKTFSLDETQIWFRRLLNRNPEPFDIYLVAKEFYVQGLFVNAMRCLELYETMEGALAAGKHLLAYCHLVRGNRRKALEYFIQCAKGGIEADYQLCVEFGLEIEEEAAGVGASSGPAPRTGGQAQPGIEQ
eukprot:GCRY01001765.1.p1 GENE.GCRY01001765.1~~GCRY01001765.1.p1  ORF type:complete len:147 (-),score=26.53 GCRY01001765.1:255-695(-)